MMEESVVDMTIRQKAMYVLEGDGRPGMRLGEMRHGSSAGKSLCGGLSTPEDDPQDDL